MQTHIPTKSSDGAWQISLSDARSDSWGKDDIFDSKILRAGDSDEGSDFA